MAIVHSTSRSVRNSVPREPCTGCRQSAAISSTVKPGLASTNAGLSASRCERHEAAYPDRQSRLIPSSSASEGFASSMSAWWVRAAQLGGDIEYVVAPRRKLSEVRCVPLWCMDSARSFELAFMYASKPPCRSRTAATGERPL